MNWTEALEIMVSRTGHARYRWLCSLDNPNVTQRDDYRSLMVRQATGQPAPSPPRVPVADAIRATKLGFHHCWFSTKDADCGCSGLRCHLRQRIVTLADCVTCLKP